MSGNNQQPTEAESDLMAFRKWWHNEGSGMPPLPSEEAEEHVKRISQIAWMNGAYVARE
jgi:hypothetical protein